MTHTVLSAIKPQPSSTDVSLVIIYSEQLWLSREIFYQLITHFIYSLQIKLCSKKLTWAKHVWLTRPWKLHSYGN